MGCHSLLQGILTQGSNPGLLHCRQIGYHLSYLSPRELETDQAGSHGPGSRFRGHMVRPRPWLPIPGILEPRSGIPTTRTSLGREDPIGNRGGNHSQFKFVASSSSGLSLECDDRAWDFQLPQLSPEGRPQVNLEGVSIYEVPGLVPAHLEAAGQEEPHMQTL